MAGHSKWANIKHRKAAQDKKRGKAFSQISRAIMAAVRSSGPNPADNITLRLQLDKARAANMPRDTIDRAIKRASGEGAAEEIHEVTYEGYGPGGVGIVISALTDNLNRTGPDVRSALEKRGGTMGKQGSVSWNFEQKAVYTVKGEGVDEDSLMEVALDAGADDLENEDGVFTIIGPPSAFASIGEALTGADYSVDNAEVTYIPNTRTMLSPDDARKLIAIIDALEDLDDVQSAITNGDIPDEVIAEMGA